MPTLEELRAWTLIEADLTISDRGPEELVDRFLNWSAAELHGILAQTLEYGWEQEEEITLDGTSEWYPLPAMVSLVTVSYRDSVQGDYLLIPRGDGQFIDTGDAGSFYDVGRTMRPDEDFPSGQRIRFSCNKAGRVMRIRFNAPYQPLVEDTDSIADVNGWGEFIVLGAAIRLLQKNGSTSEHLQARFLYQRERILKEVGLLDINQAPGFGPSGQVSPLKQPGLAMYGRFNKNL